MTTTNKSRAATHSHAAKHTSRAGLDLQNLVKVAESPKMRGATKGGAVEQPKSFFDGAMGELKSRR